MAPKKSEENARYLLATLYGVPDNLQDERWDKNRRAWNQYFAANLDEETLARLVKEKGYCATELTPFLEEELRDIRSAFAERNKETKGHIDLLRKRHPHRFFERSIRSNDRFFAPYIYRVPLYGSRVLSPSRLPEFDFLKGGRLRWRGIPR